MSTQQQGGRLATSPNPQSFRDSITVHSAPVAARINERRRLIAFCDLFRHYPRKPDAIYELQRSAPRSQLPGERERALIHDGIAQGYISRDMVVAYRTAQLADDLGAFPGSHDVEDATYCALFREVGEAVEAITIAHGLPTEANHEEAARQAREAAAVMEMHVSMTQRSA